MSYGWKSAGDRRRVKKRTMQSDKAHRKRRSGVQAAASLSSKKKEIHEALWNITSRDRKKRSGSQKGMSLLSILVNLLDEARQENISRMRSRARIRI